MRQVSTQVKLEQLEGLVDTNDLSDWETDFVESMLDRAYTNDAGVLSFTDAQVAKLEEIWSKHFA